MSVLLLLLLAAVAIDGRKKTTTCTYSHLDEPCPTNSCLPNAQVLTVGFDISDNTYKADVLGLVWGSSVFMDNGVGYTTPANVTVVPVTQTANISGTVLTHNVSETERIQSETMVDKKDYVYGMNSHTTDTYNFIDAQYAHSSNVGYVLWTQAVYEVIVPLAAQVLDDMCYKVLMALPEEYDADLYLEFIKSYGTHFIERSVWGLKYKFVSNFKECLINVKSESYVYTQVETDGWLHSSKHTSYSGYSQTDQYYESRRSAYQSFEGGNMSYHTSAQWSSWVQSGLALVNPVQIKISAKPLWSLIKDPARRANMQRATTEYLSGRKQEQELIVEQNKLKPKPVAYIEYKMGLVASTKPNILTRSVVQLASNASSALFGTVNTHCAYLSNDYGDYYDYVSQYYCHRNAKGSVAAVQYFPGWSGLPCKHVSFDSCYESKVTVYDPESQTQSVSTWSDTQTQCVGQQTTTPYVGGQYKVRTIIVDRSKRTLQPTIVSDGPYTSYISSTSILAGGSNNAAACALDCTYIDVQLNAQGAPVVSCAC